MKKKKNISLLYTVTNFNMIIPQNIVFDALAPRLLRAFFKTSAYSSWSSDHLFAIFSISVASDPLKNSPAILV